MKLNCVIVVITLFLNLNLKIELVSSSDKPHPTNKTAAPYYVKIVVLYKFSALCLYNFVKHSCGGALISNKHVLTTASCINGTLIRHVKVTYGLQPTPKYDERNGLLRDIGFYSIHPKFSYLTKSKTSRPIYDIAVIELPNEVFTNKKVRPVKMIGKDQLLSSLILVITSFMPDEPKKSKYRNMSPTDKVFMKKILKTANVLVRHHSFCQQFDLIDYYDPSHMLCLGISDFYDICDMDPGATVTALNRKGKRMLVGLVNFVFPHCGHSQVGLGFMSIRSLRDFIDEKTA